MTIAWANLLPSDLDLALRGLAARRRAFAAWWLARASAAWPEPWRAAWCGAERPTLAIWPRDGGCAAALLRRDGTAEPDAAPQDRSPAGLSAWRRSHGGPAGARLGLALDRALFFERVLTLPQTALPRLPALLDQEILCRTPFDLDEIWHGAEIRPAASGLRTVHHWILRRDLALTRLAALGVDAADLDVLILRDADGRLRPVIPLGDNAAARPAQRNRGLIRLAVAVLVATVASLAVADLWEGARAGRVADALAFAQSTAAGRTGSGHPLEALMAFKSTPGFGAVWAELSRILPDDTYLTEMRLENGTVTIRGLSNNATALVRIVSASPLFATAALTAGIAPNPKEGRDGFSLSFDLRGVKSKPRRALPVPGTGFGP